MPECHPADQYRVQGVRQGGLWLYRVFKLQFPGHPDVEGFCHRKRDVYAGSNDSGRIRLQ